MILVPKKRKDTLEGLLEETSKTLIGSHKDGTKYSGIDFEDNVYDAMCRVAKGTGYDGKVEHTGNLSFPDIVIPEYKEGVEVKVTNNGKWVSLGNSVVESTRVSEIDRLFMLFGSVSGNGLKIKYKPYGDCMAEVVVTHSPRYKISMTLSTDETIFSKMNTSYNDFRKDDPIGKVKDFYRSQLDDGQDLWWIDEEVAQELIIKDYTSLDGEDKEAFLIDVYILFPQIFSSSSTKYTKPGIYLLKKYGALSTNLRDLFSAGGREDLYVRDSNVNVSRLIANFSDIKDKFVERLAQVDVEILEEHWDDFNPHADRLEQWIANLERYANKDDLEIVKEML